MIHDSQAQIFVSTTRNRAMNKKIERAISPVSIAHRVHTASALLSITQKEIRQSDHPKALDLGCKDKCNT